MGHFFYLNFENGIENFGTVKNSVNCEILKLLNKWKNVATALLPTILNNTVTASASIYSSTVAHLIPTNRILDLSFSALETEVTKLPAEINFGARAEGEEVGSKKTVCEHEQSGKCLFTSLVIKKQFLGSWGKFLLEQIGAGFALGYTKYFFRGTSVVIFPKNSTLISTVHAAFSTENFRIDS